MTTTPRRVIVTGGAGYIGTALVRALLADPAYEDAQISLCDLDLSIAPIDPRVRLCQGDISDARTRAALLANGADVVFHLAGVLGGAAEADYALARRINLEATLSLFEDLRDLGTRPRVVFASSIAVYGPTDLDLIDDETPTEPTMVYGAQKLMSEVALRQFTARGWIDGLALRLPGIVARPGADARLKSAFLNRVFYAVAEGEDFTMPVSENGASWLISVRACVDALLHAATVAPGLEDGSRAFNLPAQRIRMADLVTAIQAHHPNSASRVSFAPDEALEAQFARQPALTTRIADGLGFRHDGDIGALVRRAYTLVADGDTTVSNGN